MRHWLMTARSFVGGLTLPRVRLPRSVHTSLDSCEDVSVVERGLVETPLWLVSASSAKHTKHTHSVGREIHVLPKQQSHFWAVSPGDWADGESHQEDMIRHCEYRPGTAFLGGGITQLPPSLYSERVIAPSLSCRLSEPATWRQRQNEKNSRCGGGRCIICFHIAFINVNEIQYTQKVEVVFRLVSWIFSGFLWPYNRNLKGESSFYY